MQLPLRGGSGVTGSRGDPQPSGGMLGAGGGRGTVKLVRGIYSSKVCKIHKKVIL